MIIRIILAQKYSINKLVSDLVSYEIQLGWYGFRLKFNRKNNSKKPKNIAVSAEIQTELFRLKIWLFYQSSVIFALRSKKKTVKHIPDIIIGQFKEPIIFRDEAINQTALIIQIFHIINQCTGCRSDQIWCNYCCQIFWIHSGIFTLSNCTQVTN